MDTLFVAEAREAAAFLEAYEATLSPDPLPNPLSRPATPVEDQQPAIVPIPPTVVPANGNVNLAPAIAEIRPMPRPEHLPQHGYHICYRNPNGSFSPLL